MPEREFLTATSPECKCGIGNQETSMQQVATAMVGWMSKMGIPPSTEQEVMAMLEAWSMAGTLTGTLQAIVAGTMPREEFMRLMKEWQAEQTRLRTSEGQGSGSPITLPSSNMPGMLPSAPISPQGMGQAANSILLNERDLPIPICGQEVSSSVLANHGIKPLEVASLDDVLKKEAEKRAEQMQRWRDRTPQPFRR